MIIIFFTVDYSKLPRSSGDGMEFSSSSSSDGSFSEGSEESDLSEKKNKNSSLVATTVRDQNSRNRVVNTSTEITNLQPKSYRSKHGSTNNQALQKLEKGTAHGYPTFIKDTQLRKDKSEPSTCIITRTESTQSGSEVYVKPVQQQNSANLLLQGSKLPQLNSQLELSLNTNDQFVSLAPPLLDLGFGESSVKSKVVEHTAEFVDSQKVINDLQEQNSKLVEEKTKLSVQLGVQTKV